jgi:hypothetical protein
MKKMFKQTVWVLALGLLCAPLCSCGSFFSEPTYSIKDVTSAPDADGNTMVTITFTGGKSPVTFTIDKGLSGKDGVGIRSVTSKTSTDGNSVTLTITFTDSTMAPVEITIPVVKGQDGKGIASCKVSTDTSGNKVIVFSYTDGTSGDPIVIPKGDQGVGIASITHDTDTSGNIVLTITFTDSTVTPVTVTVPKGTDGTSIYDISATTDGSDYVLTITFSDGVKQEVRFPKPVCNTWISGTVDPVATQGTDGDFYFNTATGDIYKKENGAWVFVMRLWQNASASYWVSFDPNGGTVGGASTVFRQKVKAGECISDLSAPVYTGHVFQGWWTSKDATDVNAGHLTVITPIFSDLTVYARWSV